MDHDPRPLTYAPIRRHAARPHRLRGQHRASWVDELAPLFNAEQRRYAAVVGTAVVGASAVALGSAAALPEGSPGTHSTADRDSIYQFAEVETATPLIDVLPREEELSALQVPPNPEAGTAEEVLEEDSASAADDEESPIAEQPPQVHWHQMVDEVSLTSLFGPRWGRNHNGIDLDGVQGDQIYAAHSGVVTKASWSGGFGNLIVIDHGDGIETYYAHASALHVSPGDEVDGGQHIMDMGNTGFSFGDHLHFEMHVDGEPMDPLSYLSEHGLDL